MTQAPELKPCPFCGGEAVESRPGDVHCKDGLCAGYKTRHMRAEQWNTRADLAEAATLDSVRAALEGAVNPILDHTETARHKMVDCGNQGHPEDARVWAAILTHLEIEADRIHALDPAQFVTTTNPSHGETK